MLDVLNRTAPFDKKAADILAAYRDFAEREFRREIEQKFRPRSAGTKAVRLQSGAKWMTQKVEFLTSLFDREYYWMRDVDGKVYLAKVGKDGTPVPLV